MAKITKKLREELVKQAVREIDDAYDYKKSRIPEWHATEDQYFGRKGPVELNRSNVLVPKMYGFVETLLAKVKTPPSIQFSKSKLSDLKKVERANGLIEQDSKPETGNWVMKDLMGKKQAIMYGRAVYEYHAESTKGYRSVLSNVDVYDFLIDRYAGGIDIEKARNLGRGGIAKSKWELEQGAENKLYIPAEVDRLLKGASGDETQQGDEDKENRYITISKSGQINSGLGDRYKFYEWYTTYKGTRYYMLVSKEKQIAVRIEELKDMFKSGYWPFATWAPTPDLIEFWTPAPCDQVRDIFSAQIVTVNQMLDAGEQALNPMKAYNSDLIEDGNLLNYRRGGLIPFTKGADLRRDLFIFPVPNIPTAEQGYQILQQIHESETGVTAASRGLGTEDKVGIYQGNMQEMADRLGLTNIMYANCQHRIAMLYWHGIKEHMTNKVAITLIGADGIEFEDEVKKKDVIGEKMFNIRVEASNAELIKSKGEKTDLLNFLDQYKDNQTINQKVLFEMSGLAVGVKQADLARLLDVSEFGDAELMAECERDIERLLSGEKFDVNDRANNAYKQRMVDYLRDHKENLIDSPEIVKAFMDYLDSIDQLVTKNMVLKANDVLAKSGKLQDVRILDAQRGLGGGIPPGMPMPQLPDALSMANAELPTSATPPPPGGVVTE